MDDYQRVRLPDVQPRTKFAYEKDAQGRITLTRMEPAHARTANVRFLKRNGRTFAVTDRPISLQAIKEASADSERHGYRLATLDAGIDHRATELIQPKKA